MKKTKPISVIIADDHDVYIDGLTLLLKINPGIKVLAKAKNGRELIELVRKFSPDVVLADLRMPVVDGVTATRLILDAKPGTRIVVLSNYGDDRSVTEAMEAGAMGYVLKGGQRGEIVKAIKAVHKGYTYHCSSTSRQLKIDLAKSKASPAMIAIRRLFSAQEIDIIRLICQENRSQEIAAIMHMSVRTVEGARLRIMNKMGVDSLVGLTIYAVQHGLYHMEDLR